MKPIGLSEKIQNLTGDIWQWIWRPEDVLEEHAYKKWLASRINNIRDFLEGKQQMSIHLS